LKIKEFGSIIALRASGATERYESVVPEERFRHWKRAGSSGCFIATACYGSMDCMEVSVLRRFRNEHLLTSLVGRIGVKAYCIVSPPIASWIRERPLVKRAYELGLRVQVGEKDQALELLEKAYKEREVSLWTLKISSKFDPIRDDPRFHDLLRRMNLIDNGNLVELDTKATTLLWLRIYPDNPSNRLEYYC